MIRSIDLASPRRLAFAASVLATSLFLLGCAKKVTDVDPSRFPEGQPSPSQLMMYEDTPVPVSLWFEKTAGAGDLDPPDSLIALLAPIYTTGPGVMQGFIIDFTPAGAFEVFRANPGSGFTLLKDFLIRPTKQWPLGQVDASRFVDRNPVAAAAYVVRGVVDGVATASSPLTNTAPTTGPVLDASIRITNIQAERGVLDTTIATITSIEWTPVVGAAGYWLHLYAMTEQDGAAIRAAGIPSPLFTGRSEDIIVAFVSAPSTSFGGGTGNPRIAAERFLVLNQPYSLRIAAVDASGRFLAYTGYADPNETFRFPERPPEPPVFATARAGGQRPADAGNASVYTFFPASALEITLQLPAPPPTRPF